EIDVAPLRELLLRPAGQRRGPRAVVTFPGTLFPLGSRNQACQLAAPVRMEGTEGAHAEGVADHLLEDPITQIALSYPVSVGDQRSPARENQFALIGKEVQADLVAEERSSPGVMIAADEIDLYPPIGKIPQRGEDTIMFRGNDGSVFEPEVEEVAIDEEPGRRAGDFRQKVAETPLGRRR